MSDTVIASLVDQIAELRDAEHRMRVLMTRERTRAARAEAELAAERKRAGALLRGATKLRAERDALRVALEMVATHRDGQCDNGYSAEFVARSALDIQPKKE